MITNEKRQAIVTALKTKAELGPGYNSIAAYADQFNKLLKLAGVSEGEHRTYVNTRANWESSPDSCWQKLAAVVGIEMD